jgi:hypothetical protein
MKHTHQLVKMQNASNNLATPLDEDSRAAYMIAMHFLMRFLGGSPGTLYTIQPCAIVLTVSAVDTLLTFGSISSALERAVVPDSIANSIFPIDLLPPKFISYAA